MPSKCKHGKDKPRKIIVYEKPAKHDKSEKEECCRKACAAVACVVLPIIRAFVIASCSALRPGGSIPPDTLTRILNFYLNVFFIGLDLFNNAGCCDKCAVEAYAEAVISFFAAISAKGSTLTNDDIIALARSFLLFLRDNKCKFCEELRCFVAADADRLNFLNAGGLLSGADTPACCEIGINIGEV